MKKQFFVYLLLLFPSIIIAQIENYLRFDNYTLGTEANSVRFFIQDPQGLMWIGTNKGLYSFDGYNAYPHFRQGMKPDKIVHCGIQYDEDHFLLGYETGLYYFNFKTEHFEPFLTDFNKDVRALLKTDRDLWIGCTEGLYKYNFDTEKIVKLQIHPENRNENNIVYALEAYGDYLYVGSYNYFGRFSLNDYTYEQVGNFGFSNYLLVNSLLKDTTRNCLWVGMQSNLYKYIPKEDTLIDAGRFYVAKSMALDPAGNVVIGTDNGLFIYNEKRTQHLLHDSRDQESLINNVVWQVYKDRSGNIWLGTDYGISIALKDSKLQNIPISKITGQAEGNHFYNISRDSHGNLWLGGSNGLIRKRDNLFQLTDARWYKMGGTEYSISHNRVRDIFLDRDKKLWIATDYGINRYNYTTQQFVQYSIVNQNGTRNANWAYDLLEDDSNRLWIATNSGGIFAMDKSKLLSGKTMLTADVNYSTNNGLSGNSVDYIVFDQKGNVWALVHGTALDVIDTQTGEISQFPIKDYTDGILPHFLMSDTEGMIWAGYRNGVVRINPLTNKVDKINFKTSVYPQILSMIEVDHSIWISSTDGIWTVNKDDLTIKQVRISNQLISSMYYDKTHGNVLFGGVDQVLVSKPEQILKEKPAKNIVISAIYVNNKLYKNKVNTPSNRYQNEIKLDHFQNNIRIEFSGLDYAKEKTGTFAYKFAEDDMWNNLRPNENTIFLNNLKPGTHKLLICGNCTDNKPAQNVKQFSILITPPWYWSTIAKTLYLLLVMTFIWWMVNFIMTRNRLKFERLEKEKSLEQSKLKISFFSDVAHEFKTPLSLIIAPLSGLIQGAKNENVRHALEMVNHNAMKLNALIHQAIDYYRDDSKVNIGLLASKVELVEFARSIFVTHKEAMKDKQIEFIFNTNADQVLMNIDTIKIESAINNLLSNACKYTHSGDSIILSIEYRPQDNGVEIKVSDTGIGIPEKDLPYVFQRFFQSTGNSKEYEGTGIGLFLVKNYVELHGGQVDVSSSIDEGTTFTVWLPVIDSNTEEKPVETNDFNDNKDKQLIVIVEDNAAIADFIYSVFTPEYRCVIAHNGKTGLKACMELNPDIIIADVMMPVMDGLEMALRLKNNMPTSTIPLVFLTAKDDKETELNSIKLNIDAFIAKPFDSTILYSRVKQLLESRKNLEKKARIDNLSLPKTEETESLDEKFLAKITKIIEDKIADPDLNVNVLCQVADISQKQLYRKVKQLTGMTAVDYIKSIRMKKAAMYLSNQNFTIAEVMFMVGFSNHSYFAKCFQAKFGVTPRQFIEQKKKI